MTSLRRTELFQTIAMLLMTCCSLCFGVKICEIWEATAYRDCTCGIKILDFEEHCQDDYTYYPPSSSQDTFYCDFQCENGGELIELGDQVHFCNCKPGFAGFCCEQETLYCGGLLLKPNGIISSPSFPNYPYPNDIECIWKITTDPGKRIAIGLKDKSFDVEEGTSLNTCDNDWIAVYDGENRSANKIGPFCGNTSRPFQTIHSSTRDLYIHFKSNNVTRRRGFQLEYTTYRHGFRCGPRTEYSLPTAIITSPQYPISYKPQESCEYKIFVKEDCELILSTLDMNLQSSADCLGGDIIEVLRINATNEFELFTRLCGVGNYAPVTVRNSTEVILKFSSGFTTSGGFKLRYEQIPTNQYYKK